MNRLTERERRLLALGLLAIVLAAVYWGVVAPVLGGFSARRTERIQLAETLQRDQRLVTLFPNLRAEEAALARDAGAYAVRTADVATARNAGEARLAALVTAAGGTLHAVRDEAGQAGEIRLRADAALTLRGLVGLLAALRSSRPFVAIKALTVSSGDASATQAPAPLEVRIDVVYAYAAPAR